MSKDDITKLLDLTGGSWRTTHAAARKQWDKVQRKLEAGDSALSVASEDRRRYLATIANQQKNIDKLKAEIEFSKTVNETEVAALKQRVGELAKELICYHCISKCHSCSVCMGVGVQFKDADSISHKDDCIVGSKASTEIQHGHDMEGPTREATVKPDSEEEKCSRCKQPHSICRCQVRTISEEEK